MATFETDEARLHRYDKMRRWKKRCEFIFDWAMWGVLLSGFITLVSAWIAGIITGLFGGDLGLFFSALFSTVGYAGAVWALYRRDWRITCAVILVLGLTGILGGSMGDLVGVILIGAVLAAQIVWGRLEKQEGFPNFDISFREQEQRQTALVNSSEHRALAAGIRAAADTPGGSEMHDVLDAGIDRPALPAHLTGYRDRAANAVPQLRAQAPSSGMMDALEDIAAPPHPAPADEIPEVPDHLTYRNPHSGS